jgi:hypothetical protein
MELRRKSSLPYLPLTQRLAQISHSRIVMSNLMNIQGQIERCDEILALVSEISKDSAMQQSPILPLVS